MRKSITDFPSRLALDSSVIISHLLGEKIGETARTLLTDDSHKLFIPHTAISEAYYQLCRRQGLGYANKAITELLGGMSLETVTSDELDIAAGRYKCERSVSLADCYVLATAKLMQATAVFARPEEDLSREQGERSFDVEISFLTDLLSSK